MYPYSPEPHQGIEASLSVSDEVIHLFVKAQEAKHYFEAPDSSTKRLKRQFVNLRKIIIEDDYFSTAEADRISINLEPLEVEWACGFCIGGRHGKG